MKANIQLNGEEVYKRTFPLGYSIPAGTIAKKLTEEVELILCDGTGIDDDTQIIIHIYKIQGDKK